MTVTLTLTSHHIFFIFFITIYALRKGYMK